MKKRAAGQPERHTDAADRTVKDIRRKTRKRYSSEDKIRVVLAGRSGEGTIAELCRTLPGGQAKCRREGGRYCPEPVSVAINPADTPRTCRGCAVYAQCRLR